MAEPARKEGGWLNTSLGTEMFASTGREPRQPTILIWESDAFMLASQAFRNKGSRFVNFAGNLS